jgi:hypothetical protein
MMQRTMWNMMALLHLGDVTVSSKKRPPQRGDAGVHAVMP